LSRPILTLKPLTPFWFVWRSDSCRIRRRHPTEADAVAEAMRLKALFPEKEFLVLLAVKRIGKAPQLQKAGADLTHL
jgi:hypothetical protein